MSSHPDTTVTQPVQIDLTDEETVLVAAYCGVQPDRIVAVYEGVLVCEPERVRRDFLGEVIEATPAIEYLTVEVVVARRTGSVAAHRFRFETVATLLDVAYAQQAPEPGKMSA